MLSDSQLQRVRANMFAAQARAYYFAQLASRYSERKRFIAAATFCLALASVVSMVFLFAKWVPLTLTSAVVFITVYTLSSGLDCKAMTMVRLYAGWSEINQDYQRVLGFQFESEVLEECLGRIARREKAVFQFGVREAPIDERLMKRCEGEVAACQLAGKAT
jgi:hypothetical protein